MEHHFEGAQGLRRAPGQKLSFIKATLLATSTLSGLMLGFAVPNLLGGDGTIVAVKSGLLAIGGLAVSYAVNRLAVERGAPLAVVGYWAAGLVSAASIAIVGAGLFSATYAGLTLHDVEQLRIEAHGDALSDFVSDTANTATQAARIIPAMAAIVGDLEQKHACEIAESCLSGYGGSGNGPVARVLLEKVGRAQTLAQQVQSSAVKRAEILQQVARLHDEYQTTTGSSDLDAEGKRRALQGLDLKIKQAAASLEEAVPVPLLLAYAEELKAAVMIEGRLEVSAKVSGILQQHGQTLSQLAESIPQAQTEAPAFPKATGVADTFSYLGHFLPIAAIAAVVELVFPISLWLYTIFTLSWARERIAPRRSRAPDPEEEAFQRLMSHPALQEEASFTGKPDPEHASTGVRRGRPPAATSGDAFPEIRRAPRN